MEEKRILLPLSEKVPVRDKITGMNINMSLADALGSGMVSMTDILIKNHETGEVLFRGSNKVIVSGSGLVARKLFDINTGEVTPSYNTALNIPNGTGAAGTVNTYTSATDLASAKVLLFCCGTDGCGPEPNQVYSVSYKKWLAPENIVAFRYPLSSADLSSELRKLYFGRTPIIQDGRIAYYFKRFNNYTNGYYTFVQQYADGTPITNNIYTNPKEDDVESFVELQMSITKDDVREWFTARSGIANAKINTIELCSAWPEKHGGIIYWQDIRPVTKLNFDNKLFSDPTVGLDIVYHVYF